tara:strand:+ start:5514 stop:5855 length:342 start_codon:yes stop_codon:yes gene_type:complete
MANMIKLPYEDGGNLALNVDGAIDVTLVGTDQLNIDYDVYGWTLGEYIQVQLTFTTGGPISDLDQDDADALLATIKRASQAPNSQPIFQPNAGNMHPNTIASAGGIVVDDVTP